MSYVNFADESAAQLFVVECKIKVTASDRQCDDISVCYINQEASLKLK